MAFTSRASFSRKRPVLVDVVDHRDELAREGGHHLLETSTDALGRLGLDTRDRGNRGQEVADGGEATALATCNVVEDGALGGTSETLNSKVVVGNGGTVALDCLEDVVSHKLDTLSDLTLHGLLHG